MANPATGELGLSAGQRRLCAGSKELDSIERGLQVMNTLLLVIVLLLLFGGGGFYFGGPAIGGGGIGLILLILLIIYLMGGLRGGRA